MSEQSESQRKIFYYAAPEDLDWVDVIDHAFEDLKQQCHLIRGSLEAFSLLGIQELLTIPEIWRAIRDVHEPLFQGRQALKVGFYGVHCLFGQFDASLIDACYQFDDWMFPFPGHRAGILDHRVYRVKQGTIPVLLQNPPTPFDRVVFAMIWRIIFQTDGDLIPLHKFLQTLH